MGNKIDRKRWKVAQKLELLDWKNKEITEKEFIEIKLKYSKILREIARKVKFSKKFKVLDVGCGPTCISRLLPVSKKWGIDPLAKKLGVAGKEIDGVFVSEGRGEKIPFKDKDFDFVICRNAIDHAQNPEKIIKECLRVLKPGGYFVLACYIYPRFIVTLKRLSEAMGFLQNLEHPFAFTAQDLANLCRERFKIVDEKIIFEGKHSTDFGKVGEIKPDRSIVNKMVMWVNSNIFGNKWFVREHLILSKKS